MEGLAEPDEALQAQLLDFLRDGMIHVPDVLEPDLVAELLGLVEAANPAGAMPVEGDFFKVGEGRYTAPLPIGTTLTDPRLYAHPTLEPLLDGILGPEWVIEAFGVVNAVPGATDQHRHSDGALLFDHGLDRVLPATALTLAIPLVDVDASNGRTAFWLGSHRRDLTEGRPADRALDCAAGDALLWDFRIRHLGEANASSRQRPMLYLTYCRPWWVDHKNFKPGKNAKLLVDRTWLAAQPDKRLRKRFVRAQLTNESLKDQP